MHSQSTNPKQKLSMIYFRNMKLLQDVVLITALLVVLLSSISEANFAAVNVFHRYSPLSPFYDPSLNETEILIRDFLRSTARARAKRLSSRFTTTGERLETIVYPGGGGYLMRIYIGKPPVEQIVSIDTGSSLTWVQCEPCDRCFKQDVPKFNRLKSQSYMQVSCDSETCDYWKSFTDCRQRGNIYCSYRYRYIDGGLTIGELAEENVGLTADKTKRVLMGCGIENSDHFYAEESGVCGLGHSNLSLVSQLADKNAPFIFSYCLAPVNLQKPGKLTFQTNSTFRDEPGVLSTSMILNLDGYAIFLSGISVKDDPELVTPMKLVMLMDSGSTLTWLHTNYYDQVEAKVIQSVGEAPMDLPPYPFRVCYLRTALSELPDINFHFTDTTVRFTGSQLWVAFKGALCLMISPHEDERHILGYRAQVNFKVEYNLQDETLSFQPKEDCGDDA